MGKNNINLTNGLFTRKEEYPTSRLGEEEMQQRLVSTGFGFLYFQKEIIPSHKTCFASWSAMNRQRIIQNYNQN